LDGETAQGDEGGDGREKARLKDGVGSEIEVFTVVRNLLYF
jgi:hypothetical protein